jgi:translation initiation factor IF-2
MQQRQLRLGDIVDDYCPRERRVTNHAIVAMVEQDVKQTRCTTCDTEHEYKQAKVPPQRRKKAAPGALYQEVLAAMPRKPGTAGSEVPDEPSPVLANEPEPPAVAAAQPEPERVDEVEGPVHRPLIRATLPRPIGEAPTRQAPEFTIRQPLARPGRFRPGGGGGAGRRGPAGHGANNGGFEFGGRRNTGAAPGGPHGHGNRARPAPGERQGPPQHRRRGGKKRTK